MLILSLNFHCLNPITFVVLAEIRTSRRWWLSNILVVRRCGLHLRMVSGTFRTSSQRSNVEFFYMTLLKWWLVQQVNLADSHHVSLRRFCVLCSPKTIFCCRLNSCNCNISLAVTIFPVIVNILTLHNRSDFKRSMLHVMFAWIPVAADVTRCQCTVCESQLLSSVYLQCLNGCYDMIVW